MKDIDRLLSEIQANLPADEKERRRNDSEEVAKAAYGDEYGEEMTIDTSKWGRIPVSRYHNLYLKPRGSKEKVALNVKKDADLTTGLFSQGNAKLSPDTLIMDFTTAHRCPSVALCPIQQAACYAIGGESRYPSVMRKHLMVQGIVSGLIKRGQLDKFFELAKKYIKNSIGTPYEIHWVRFNENGDFPTTPPPQNSLSNMAFKSGKNYALDAATKFAEEIDTDEYGHVQCMAYSANGVLDFSKASKVMAINASTDAVLRTVDPSSTKRSFYGLPEKSFMHDFVDTNNGIVPDNSAENIGSIADAEVEKSIELLDINDKTQEVDVATLGHLRHLGTLKQLKEHIGMDTNRFDMTIPILETGNWGETDGDGNSITDLYYVCPCGFWKDNKDIREMELVESAFDEMYGIGKAKEYKIFTTKRWQLTAKNGVKLGKVKFKYAKPNEIGEIQNRCRKIRNELSRFPSPCGIQCGVCYDRKGGILLSDAVKIYRGEMNQEEANREMKYYVLTAMHGNGKENFDKEYANQRRHAKDITMFNKRNTKGKIKMGPSKSAEEHQDLVNKRIEWEKEHGRISESFEDPVIRKITEDREMSFKKYDFDQFLGRIEKY